mmetsp:Transcript_8101/g.12389  ORF Transcript_8101/g.12389 Transcript_8101/m.12389 type:complete len:397 (-) Transcript_8101:131-1321(-)|eukprot:CAMPEP_0178928154 /NCGR_PEP_ID=MMETSP0786-20121207/19696_1 /TAXON_ID=186022 /ORGANISM="Thalassionema frauenfeldii, Strain CCMP 1798" /LENGTH=396 /DNA_ID=CAMNT_0020603887 /DNA_START=93 /DNA_END=1283 /DNA_ORIENTATION=+
MTALRSFLLVWLLLLLLLLFAACDAQVEEEDRKYPRGLQQPVQRHRRKEGKMMSKKESPSSSPSSIATTNGPTTLVPSLLPPISSTEPPTTVQPHNTSPPSPTPTTPRPTHNDTSLRRLDLLDFTMFSETPIPSESQVMRSMMAYLNVFFAARHNENDDGFLETSLYLVDDDETNSVTLGGFAVYKAASDVTDYEVYTILRDAINDLNTLQSFLNFAMGEFAPEIERIVFEETLAPSSLVPTTTSPSMTPPTTSVPTTSVPTTSAPTTSAPTTSVPTTPIPTTSEPSHEMESDWIHCGAQDRDREWCYLPRQDCNLDTVGNSFCTCKSGWKNENNNYCNSDLDECMEVDPYPCFDGAGGHCVNHFPDDGEYSCRCDDGYRGEADEGHGPTVCVPIE